MAISPAAEDGQRQNMVSSGQPVTSTNHEPLVAASGLLPLTIEPDSQATAAPASPASPKRSKTASAIGYGSLGTGIASMVAGTGSYVVAQNKKDTSNCRNYYYSYNYGECNSDSYKQYRDIAIVALLGGATLLTIGMVTLYSSNTEHAKPKVALAVGPMSAGVEGAF
jgi:hypothetical protein